jgi:hypothetical protein
VKEFTIASANTWEYFSLTFSANTSNKINNDTGSGMIVSFPLTAGSNFQVSADTWASGEDFATSNQQNLLDSDANNIYLSGVQLEVGSVATDFAHEDIGTTLRKCQRYFERLDFSTSSSEAIAACNVNGTNQGNAVLSFSEKRASPTFSSTAVDTFEIRGNNAAYYPDSSVAYAQSGPRTAVMTLNFSTTPLTQGDALKVHRNATDTCYIDISAEL